MAWRQNPQGPQQCLAVVPAAPITRAQRSGKHLAIHAAELVVKPRLQNLRRHRRPLLLCLEHVDRPALENHVGRASRLGNCRSPNLRIGINPVGRDGKPAILATVMDISARKRAEEHQRLLVGELTHRTRNLFAVLGAIIANTLKEAKTVAEANIVLQGRLQALSEAYSLLADAAWEGTSLAKILSSQSMLDPKRVAVDGCEIAISPRAAQQFAMIVHELATNAVKYGALSSSKGRVSISGKLERSNGSEAFVFSWKEAGGPRVSPPTRRGFGSVILLEAAQQFGEVTVKYSPEGLIYQLQLDLKAIEPTQQPLSTMH